MVRSLLAGIGAFFVVLWLGGALGIGHLYVYFGAQPITCTKESRND